MHKLKSLTNKLILIYLVSLLGVSPSVSAKMYKWVDADGNTHYTQSPPPGDIEGETIKPPPKVDTDTAQKDLEAQKQRANDLLKQRTDAKEETQKQEQEASDKKARCDQARARLASFQRPRVNLKDEGGNPIRATEEERVAGLEKAQKYLDENCN